MLKNLSKILLITTGGVGAVSKMKCLIATSFEGLQEPLGWLEKNFDCHYKPDAVLPENGDTDFEVLVVNPNNLRFNVNSNTIGYLKNLKIVLTISTGVAHIDMDYISDRNIELISLKHRTGEMGAVTATAELAFLLSLGKERHIPRSMSRTAVVDWDWRPYVGRQLSECQIAIIGYGRLGKLYDGYCKAFGGSTNWFDPNVEGGANDIDALVRTADVIALHASYTPGDKPIVSADLLKNVKENVHFVNTSRGELVDENALSDFLKNNPGSYYSSDVIANEVNRELSPIFKLWDNGGNVTLTPHMGGMTSGSRKIAYSMGVSALIEHVGGTK